MHFRAKNHLEKQVLPHSQIPQIKKKYKLSCRCLGLITQNIIV
jgi:hypothetical protein